MGTTLRLVAADGHELDAYVAGAEARAGLVVVQEIFGVNGHIRRVVEQYAAQGFLTVAPAMFDRVQRGVELTYTQIDEGRALMQRLEWPATLQDVAAAVREVRGAGRVGIVGFCWGGTVAHVAASELEVDAAVAYYGGGVAKMLDKQPRCPILYHFGDQDHAIPLADVAKVQAAGFGSVHVYAGAGHGFNCDERASFSPAAAQLAFERSVAFLHEHLA